MRLRTTDLDRAILATSAVTRLSELAEDALPRLTALIGGGESLLYHFAGGVPAMIGGSAVSTFRAYLPEYYAEDPIHPALRRMPASTYLVALGQLGVIEAGFMDTRVFAEFYAPLRLQHLLGVWPDGRGYGNDDQVGLVFARSTPFEGACAPLLDLKPFWRAAIERCLRLDPGPTGLAATPRPHLTWGLDGTLRDLSDDAERLLPRGRVPEPLTEGARAFGQSIGRGLAPTAASAVAALTPTCRLRVDYFVSGAPMPWSEPLVGGMLQLSLGQQDAPLSETERTVLVQLSLGLSNREIGERMFIAEATVRTHVRRILSKLAVSSRVQAALLAHTQLLGMLRPHFGAVPVPAGQIDLPEQPRDHRPKR